MVVARVADILRPGEPTKFARMGAVKSGLRMAFVECGHSWGLSNWCAERIVLAALNQIGARFPTWLEGQPEAVATPGFSPSQRYFCARCARPLGDDRWMYCSRLCSQAAANDRRVRELREMDEVQREAAKLIRRHMKMDHFAARRTFACEWCGGVSTWKPTANPRRYCSRTCAAKARWAARQRVISYSSIAPLHHQTLQASH